MKIEVIESIGRHACKSLFGNVLEAVKAAGLNGRVVVVSDLRTMLRYGVKAAPALVVNGIVICAGQLLPPEEIMKLLQQNLSPFS